MLRVVKYGGLQVDHRLGEFSGSDIELLDLLHRLFGLGLIGKASVDDRVTAVDLAAHPGVNDHLPAQRIAS